VWPVVLLLLLVLVPAVSLVWFMNAAMRNERLAAREQLTEVYRAQLSSVQSRFEEHWSRTIAALNEVARSSSPAAAFAKCVQAGAVDSVIVFDEQGRVAYPGTPSAPTGEPEKLPPQWAEASRLEYARKEPAQAAKAYHALAVQATNVHLAARAFQAEARCLVQSEQKDAAIQLITETLSDGRFDHAVDAQGRVIAANAELMMLELLTNHALPVFHATAERLRGRLVDYDSPVLASAQRLFLMKELLKLRPEIQFPTLPAEELAAAWRDNRGSAIGTGVLKRAPVANHWQFLTGDRRVIALLRPDKLMPANANLPKAEVALLPPDVEREDAFVTMAAGSQFPGWRMALALKDQRLIVAATKSGATLYLWTATLVVGIMGMLMFVTVRILRRQVALARLKNDLAATVSHELKTPLSSMRVLVDTLLQSERLDEATAREYLELIAGENERLSRLIQNFLTYSRMDRRKHAFQLRPASPRQIIDSAVKAMSARFEVPGCRFEVQVDSDLPEIMADSDALTTALANLLDNAYKYSEEIKHIVLRARAVDGQVSFSVQDNGFGIAPRETKKIFWHFYQVDQRLSRACGGCGLGLGIVQFIVEAHDGVVTVESQPGRGSTFSITLPALEAAAPGKEATG
jgi:signal transduction histidine kinase